MKKLYHAEISGDFVFVIDDKDDNKSISVAYEYLREEGVNLSVDNVDEIIEVDDIPVEWKYNKPLGADDIGDGDCDSYFECKDVAESITQGLKELEYELEPTFTEDLRRLLVKEI